MGGCATPISALAQIEGDRLYFQGNVVSLDGSKKVDINKTVPLSAGSSVGREAGQEILAIGAAAIIQEIRNAGK